jgi:uncharacterized protein
MERTKETEWTLNPVDWFGLVILIIGGLNWGLVGLFNYNLITALFGDMTTLARIVYTIVGLAGIWSIIGLVTHLHQRPYGTRETPVVTR